MESSSTSPILGASFSGEILDPPGQATDVVSHVAFLLWGVALKILLPSAFLGGLDAHGVAVGRWPTADAWVRVTACAATMAMKSDGLVAARSW